MYHIFLFVIRMCHRWSANMNRCYSVQTEVRCEVFLCWFLGWCAVATVIVQRSETHDLFCCFDSCHWIVLCWYKRRRVYQRHQCSPVELCLSMIHVITIECPRTLRYHALGHGLSVAAHAFEHIGFVVWSIKFILCVLRVLSSGTWQDVALRPG